MAIPLYNEAGECIGIQNEPDWQRSDGRRAAENGKPRKCPCYMPADRALWFEGYDAVILERDTCKLCGICSIHKGGPSCFDEQCPNPAQQSAAQFRQQLHEEQQGYEMLFPGE